MEVWGRNLGLKFWGFFGRKFGHFWRINLEGFEDCFGEIFRDNLEIFGEILCKIFWANWGCGGGGNFGDFFRKIWESRFTAPFTSVP